MTTNWHPSASLFLAWLSLLALLALTVAGSYLHLGEVNMLLALAIGAFKAAIVAAVFMELRNRGRRMYVFALAGLFWLGILLWLGLMDFVTRT